MQTGIKRLFGTDGVRGTANTEPLTVETILKLGRAAGYVFKKNHRRHRIVIGKDTRLSGYMLESALTSGICSMGVDVVLVGPLPTPGIAFITRSLRADAGVMLSASHNSYEDNGIKFFSHDGYKLPEAMEKRMEDLIFSGKLDDIRPTATDVGKAFRDDDAIGRYVEFIKNSFPKGMTLDGYRVVLDCANGAAYKVAPKVLRELGAEVIVYNDRPDGSNINKNCGSTYPQVIRKAVIDHSADIGISLDGDADRVILADNEAREVDGDQILAICALDMLREGRLKDNTVVATVMSNLGLELALAKEGGKVLRASVGDRFVLEEMLKSDVGLGGEQSGHVIFRDFTTTGDGLITALQVFGIMRKTGKPLAKLARCMERVPQILLNVRVKEKVPFENIPELRREMESISNTLGSNGRLLTRYSGTEKIARVMIEGTDQDIIGSMASRLAALIEQKLGTV